MSGIGRAYPRRSPWDADPLSWLAVPNLPLAAFVFTGGYGMALVLFGGQAGPNPALQAIGIVLALLGMAWVHVSTRPRRGPLTPGRSALAVALVGAGFVVSALGYRGGTLEFELWWAPLAAALLLLSMAPYSGPTGLLVSGIALLGAALASAIVVGVPETTRWPPLASLGIIVTPAIFGTAGGIAFISTVTSRLERWSERPWREQEDRAVDDRLEEVDDPLAAEVDERTSAQLTEAVGLLARILERGQIDAADQASASLVAGRLRAELLASANDSWLERMARGRPVRVDDPTRLAERLGVPQRTALRALLDALLENPESGFISARIELREPAEGTIAVALRILTTLAEGRRVTYLAPYYVSLRSTVTGISWRDGSSIALDFVTTTDPDRVESPVAQRLHQRPE